MSEGKRILGYDIVRAIAIILVIVAHSGRWFEELIPYSMACGVLGVELFFVLSGLLIGGIILRSLESEWTWSTVLNFWKRRWFRTLPNYYLALFAHLALFVLISKDIEKLLVSSGDIAQHLVFMQNFAWAREKWIMGVSWSLAVEEWFYLTIPLLLLCSGVYFKKVKWQALAAILIICILPLCYRILVWQTPMTSWNDEVRCLCINRLDAIGFGFMGAWLYRYTNFFKWKPLCLFIIGVFLVLAAHYINYTEGVFDWYYDDFNLEGFHARTTFFTMLSIGVMLMFPYVQTIGCSDYSLFRKVVVFLSLTSYSVYLYHLPVFTFIDKVFIKLHFSYPLVQSFLGYVGTLLVSYVVYRYFEVKCTEFLRNRYSKEEK